MNDTSSRYFRISRDRALRAGDNSARSRGAALAPTFVVKTTTDAMRLRKGGGDKVSVASPCSRVHPYALRRQMKGTGASRASMLEGATAASHPHTNKRRSMARRLRLSCAYLTMALVCAVAGAQSLTGNIYGKITDEQGGTLPGVTVALSGVGGGQNATTDSRGEFHFLSLSPGVYTVTTTLQGFS